MNTVHPDLSNRISIDLRVCTRISCVSRPASDARNRQVVIGIKVIERCEKAKKKKKEEEKDISPKDDHKHMLASNERKKRIESKESTEYE